MQLRCTSPKTVGFKPDGKTIAWSQKTYSKEFATFQLPCGKCLSCRLENARQTAVRCVHEASMYERNCFITLTYDNEHLKSPKLKYEDFQAFVKALRTRLFDDLLKKMFPYTPTQKYRRKRFKALSEERQKELREQIQIGIFCAGEYGDEGKRPHWHALIFNWSPTDSVYKYSNSRGDQVFTSAVLTSLWPHGNSEFGSLTFESAGYCARYAAKKLRHGRDGDHEYEPISRRSSKNAIGKRWIEKHWRDVFSHGVLKFDKGDQIISCGIPRYYEKWLKKNLPAEWTKYITEVKPFITQAAEAKEAEVTLEEKKANFLRSSRKGISMKPVKTRRQSRADILEQKFSKLQERLKI